MSKIIRPTYPAGFSFGLLLLIFVIIYFLSHQIFDVRIHDLDENKNVYFGMFLAAMAVIIMILIVWEEFLFPVRIKVVDGGIMFRNHRTKLVAQLLIYLTIPAIFTFIYFNYEVKAIRFWIWAVVCIGTPAIEKIFSGINNYNDFLKLTDTEIAYKNNELEGKYLVKEIKSITIVKDDRNVINKIKLFFITSDNVTIDLDEMELDAFYDSISTFITERYAELVMFTQVARTA